MNKNARLKNPVRTLLFFGVLAFLYTPLFYLMFQAFLVSPFSPSQGFTLRWIFKLFESDTLWEPLLNSIEISTVSATFSTILALFGAIGLSRHRMSLPPSLNTLIMLPILLPEVITGISLLLFFLFLGIPFGKTTVILAHTSFSASFVYFIIVEQLEKLDSNLIDAAIDLGATSTQALFKVILPNILPGLVGGWLLAFTLSFDDFLISFFVAGAGLTTLPLKIYSLLRVGITPELNALCFVMIVTSVSLVLLLVCSKESRKWVTRE